MKEQKKLSNDIGNNSCERRDKSSERRNIATKLKIISVFLIGIIVADIITGYVLLKTNKVTGPATPEKHFDKSIFVSRSLDDPEQFPLGSCNDLNGTILVISIFADDAQDSWDFSKNEDIITAKMMYEKLLTAFDWISQKGSDYGKEIVFISDFYEYPELAYKESFDIEFTDGYRHIEKQKTALLANNWNKKGIELMDKYKADNIMFVYYFNKKPDTTMTPFASPYILSDQYTDYPLETLMVTPYAAGVQQGAATYAHEILHLFGAPDLYIADADGMNHGITQEFVDYCRLRHKNEIMVTNYDINTLLPDPYDITNELTELTAYYLGWIDTNAECEAFGVDTSEHAAR